MEVTPLRRLHLIRAAKAAHLLLKEKAFGWLHFIRDTNRCVPPHPLRYAQHLPPSGGRLLLSCIFIMLDRSCQLSHSANSASRTQHCRLPIQIQLSFTSHTGSLLLSSPKKVTFPSSPRPPSSPPSSLLHFAKFVHTRREDCTLRRGKRGIIIYA